VLRAAGLQQRVRGRRAPVGRERARAEALAARIWEFSQFLTDVLGVERLPVTYRAVATMHHSCHTMRMLGVREGPERLLGMVDGLEYRPLARAQDCCGFGGTFAVKMAAVSAEMVDRKASHVCDPALASLGARHLRAGPRSRL